MKEWNIRTGECLRSIVQTSVARTLNITKSKSKLVCCLESGIVEFRRAVDLGLINSFRRHEFEECCCCCELEDGSFVSGGTAKILRWDEEGRLLQTFTGHDEYTSIFTMIIELSSGVIVSIVSCSEDVTLKIWDVSTGLCLRTLDIHGDAILVKLSRDRFLSWGHEGTLRVWNERGDCNETIRVDGNSIATARVGNHIVTAIVDSYYSNFSLQVRRLKTTLMEVCCAAIAMSPKELYNSEELKQVLPEELFSVCFERKEVITHHNTKTLL